MHLVLVGISHRTAPVDLRERVDFATRGLPAALQALGTRAIAREAVVLSTCNRAEIYIACEDAAAAPDSLVGFITDFHGVSRSDIAEHVYDAAGRSVRHLSGREGETLVRWDGRDERGRVVTPGVYWIEARVGPLRRGGRVVRLP